jgi:hypothetical protein
MLCLCSDQRLGHLATVRAAEPRGSGRRTVYFARPCLVLRRAEASLPIALESRKPVSVQSPGSSEQRNRVAAGVGGE